MESHWWVWITAHFHFWCLHHQWGTDTPTIGDLGCRWIGVPRVELGSLGLNCGWFFEGCLEIIDMTLMDHVFFTDLNIEYSLKITSIPKPQSWFCIMLVDLRCDLIQKLQWLPAFFCCHFTPCLSFPATASIKTNCLSRSSAVCSQVPAGMKSQEKTLSNRTLTQPTVCEGFGCWFCLKSCCLFLWRQVFSKIGAISLIPRACWTKPPSF